MLELNSYYIHQFKLIICGTITVSLMESVARKEDGSPKLSINAQHSSTANSVPHRQRPESRAASSPEAMPLHFLPLLKFTRSFTLFSRGFWTAESQHPALCDLGSGKTGTRQAPPGEPTPARAQPGCLTARLRLRRTAATSLIWAQPGSWRGFPFAIFLLLVPALRDLSSETYVAFPPLSSVHGRRWL